ncbi:sarcosine oxidase subunit gamma [Pontibacterium sp. N1Y112]|uniref:Sarcosine oxidase subunit gamma n=1 Tax=Pontibacterium sinense TaxID=2781979 RepID=A0A8J7FLD6_9GAMM|nr:sarcosine oxidase subunit gamma family protein [Pontibacterium sinense]MBE9398353.1 sarcosine oxidase subunit gamma [Pontibacterium sinense]
MSDLTVAVPEEKVASTKAVVMNQVAGPEVRAESPLYHADLDSLAKQGPRKGGVRLRENKLLGHLTLRCNPNNADQLAAVERVLGMALPLQPLTSVEKGDVSIRWMSPDEWLIIVPGLKAFDVETRFRDEMDGHYSLVNGSGGSTVLELSGDNVVDMLKKSTPIDLHPSEFPVGKVVSTVFAKSTAVIRRTGEKQFELVIRRSFSDYLWLWIQDASREFGLVVDA